METFIPQGGKWPIPFILDPHHLALDATISFIVSALLALMINAEGQAWVSTMLGDLRPDAKDRFHFNAFLHVDITGSLCYLVAGFGWPKRMDIDPSKFKHPELYLFLSRLAGPIANLLMASVAVTLVFLIRLLDMVPLVFLMVVGVNVTTAVYNLIPIPPLAASTLITMWIPEESQNLRKFVNLAGPFLIVSIFLAERITGEGIISPYLNPIVKYVVEVIVYGG
jgi:Zn-dependent protease